MAKNKGKNWRKFTEVLQGLGFLFLETFYEDRRVRKGKGRGRPKTLRLRFHAYRFIGPRMEPGSEEWARLNRVIPRAYFKVGEKAFLFFALSPVSLELFTSPPFPISDLRFLGVIRSLKGAPDLREEDVKELSDGKVPFPSWFADPTYDRLVLGWLEDMARLPVGSLIVSALPFGFMVITKWEIDRAKQSLDAFDYLLNKLGIDVGEWEEVKGEDPHGFDLLGFLHRITSYIMGITERCIYCGSRILQKTGKREKFFCKRSHNVAFKIHLRKYAHNYPDLVNLSRREIMKRFRELGFEETKRRYPLLVARG